MSRETSTPCLSSGDLTVVIDGTARLRWTSTGPAEWRLRDVWPSPQEARALHERIGRGDRLLVVLEPDARVFAAQAEAATRAIPVALRPPLLVEADPGSCAVRFARCTATLPRREALLETARHVFAAEPVPAVTG